jgi:hypothetical protein
MHVFLLVISLLLVFAAAALADPQAAPETVTVPKTAMSATELQTKSEAYFKQCLSDWDAATHMTKIEWQRTCRRIADERIKFMAEQMGK